MAELECKILLGLWYYRKNIMLDWRLYFSVIKTERLFQDLKKSTIYFKHLFLIFQSTYILLKANATI